MVIECEGLGSSVGRRLVPDEALPLSHRVEREDVVVLGVVGCLAERLFAGKPMGPRLGRDEKSGQQLPDRGVVVCVVLVAYVPAFSGRLVIRAARLWG